MNLTTTLLFYLLFGVAVAAAVHLVLDAATDRERWFRTLTAVFFWPLYLPAVLQRSADPSGALALDSAALSSFSSARPRDATSEAINQVEAELDLALGSLNGWSDAVLKREQHRFEELRAAWRAQAEKIHELDQLLEQGALAEPSASVLTASGGERVVASERARHANIARLRAVRLRLHDDLMNTLAWVRELATMIHLAKYTGAPASRAEELVMQIATSVKGLSEVAAWRDEESATAG